MIAFDFGEFQLPELSISVTEADAAAVTRFRIHEVAIGFDRGWLSAASVVSLELDSVLKGRPVTADEETLALLLSDELDRVGPILGPFRRDPNLGDLDVWLFLFLRSLYAARAEYPDPWQMVEMLWDSFGHPESVDFVPFFPLPAGQQGGEAWMLERWASYLESETLHFQTRPLYPLNDAQGDVRMLARHLKNFGERRWSSRLIDLDQSFGADPTGAVGTLRSFFGGTGSLTDLRLSGSNGHAIAADEEAAANQTLSELRERIWDGLDK